MDEQNCTAAFLEVNQRLAKDLGLETAEVTEDELRGVQLERYKQAFISVATTNPDGSKRSDIEYQTPPEVIGALREQYGDRITDEEYGILEQSYDKSLGLANIAETIDTAVLLAMHPRLNRTPLGRYSRKLLQGILKSGK